MKTTPLQNKIIEICKTELSCWQDSNDINSPTHYNEGEIALYELDYDGELEREDCDYINHALQRLRASIIEITKHYD